MATTYSALKTRIQNTMENDSTEFVSAISDFINSAEQRLTRELDPSGLTRFTTSTFTANDPFVTLPTTALIINNINYINASNNRVALRLRSKEFIDDYWPIRASVGSPKYYAKYRNDKILVAPTPSAALVTELEYVAFPSALSSTTQTTNYFTQFCENALFYAAMVEACLYAKNSSALQVWEAQYQREAMSLLNEARRNRRDDMEQSASPSGGGNTLMDNAR